MLDECVNNIEVGWQFLFLSAAPLCLAERNRVSYIRPEVPELPTREMVENYTMPWLAERGTQLTLGEPENADDPWHPLYGRDIRMEYTALTGRTLEEGLVMLERYLEAGGRLFSTCPLPEADREHSEPARVRMSD